MHNCFILLRLRLDLDLVSCMQNCFQMQNRRHPQPERCSWHEVCNDALMGLAFVDLSELFFSVEFYPNAIF